MNYRYVAFVQLALLGCSFAEEGPKPVDQSKLAVVVHVTDPKPDVKEYPTKEVTVSEDTILTDDEIKYVKDMFKSAVLDSALALSIVQVQASIIHPQNPVTKFLQTKVFKGDMENQIFSTVYAPALNAGQHSLNLDGERKFLLSKINEKMKEDPKFFNLLLAAVKETIKPQQEK